MNEDSGIVVREINGFSYSLEKFEGYLFIANVQLKVAESNEIIVVNFYTNNPSAENAKINIEANISDEFVEMLSWTSKEVDDLLNAQA